MSFKYGNGETGELVASAIVTSGEKFLEIMRKIKLRDDLEKNVIYMFLLLKEIRTIRELEKERARNKQLLFAR